MMGPKTLRTIREELERALASTGEDPIQWLEVRIAKSKGKTATDSEKTDVLECLWRFLDQPRKRKPRKQRAPTKK